MASILCRRTGKRSAKTNVLGMGWNSMPMSSHRFRKVCMDMPCGTTTLAIPTSHHDFSWVWRLQTSGNSNNAVVCPTIGKWQSQWLKSLRANVLFTMFAVIVGVPNFGRQPIGPSSVIVLFLGGCVGWGMIWQQVWLI